MLKEVRVRFVGFGAEEDEWVNIKKAVRERSIPLEHSECHKVKVGDLVLCFQVIVESICFRIQKLFRAFSATLHVHILAN